MRPNRSTAARAAASASVRLVTSSLTGSRSFDCPKALDTRSLSRPEATTAWPASRAALAKSTPMPRPAPVMNQTFLLLMTSPCSTSRNARCGRRSQGLHRPRTRAVPWPGRTLQVPGDSQRANVHGFEADITNQPRRDVFRALVVPAVHEARPATGPSFGLVYGEQHLTRDSTERGDDVGLSNLLGQPFCTRRGVGDGERGVVRFHRE